MVSLRFGLLVEDKPTDFSCMIFLSGCIAARSMQINNAAMGHDMKMFIYICVYIQPDLS